MFARVLTAAVKGVDAIAVQAEVNLSAGLPSFTVVGLAQGSVREGRERVAAALRNSGFDLPGRRITVNLAPADLRKEGTAFDLSIAIGLLAAAGRVAESRLDGLLFVGELGLDGSLRPVAAVLSVALMCRDAGLEGIVVPHGNAAEASLVAGLNVVPGRHLEEIVSYLRGEVELSPPSPVPFSSRVVTSTTDLSDVRGQESAKRALEIAAAGSHNVLLIGPPGSGKTMLATRLPGILPPMDVTEALEVARVHSVAGLLRDGCLLQARPFRAPHHSVSYAGLTGGGTPVRPGEISLANHGVLFLDEFPEYRRDALEALRQPLEDGVVQLARAAGAVVFPARFLLAAAMNPCPCGFHGDDSDRCLCDGAQIRRYRSRISGPLTDRMDLCVEVPAVRISTLSGQPRGETTSVVARRVAAARSVQGDRFREAEGVFANAHVRAGLLRRWCRPSRAGSALLRRVAERAGLSARGHDRVLRVARTIADLAGEGRAQEEHVAEALQYRAIGSSEGVP